jgi:hypothetical protein
MRMSSKLSFKSGKYFSAPLRGGGYAYGYLTLVDCDAMYLCNVHDRIGNAPEVPEDIHLSPIMLRDLRISGAEFSIKPKQVKAHGARWLMATRCAAEPVAPHVRYFLIGERGAERVFDVLGDAPQRPATVTERAKLQRLGFSFPPMPIDTIEVALRRLDIDPSDFEPRLFLQES